LNSPVPDQKSKKKKKSKKKGTAQPAIADVPSTPTETNYAHNGPDDDDDDGEHDDGEVDEASASPVKEQPPAAETLDTTTAVTNGVKQLTVDSDKDDAAARFDALVKDRDALRQEVTQLRQSLEELQARHTSEIEAVQGELADTQAEKENAEEQYQSLLGKVNTIRSQLGERLKADAVGTD
jgi:dynactin complex subunit